MNWPMFIYTTLCRLGKTPLCLPSLLTMHATICALHPCGIHFFVNKIGIFSLFYRKAEHNN